MPRRSRTSVTAADWLSGRGYSAAAAGRGELYREASRYAGKFCARLERLLARDRAAPHGTDCAVLAELRRFYRLTHARKRALIEGIA